MRLELHSPDSAEPVLKVWLTPDPAPMEATLSLDQVLETPGIEEALVRKLAEEATVMLDVGSDGLDVSFVFDSGHLSTNAVDLWNRADLASGNGEPESEISALELAAEQLQSMLDDVNRHIGLARQELDLLDRSEPPSPSATRYATRQREIASHANPPLRWRGA